MPTTTPPHWFIQLLLGLKEVVYILVPFLIVYLGHRLTSKHLTKMREDDRKLQILIRKGDIELARLNGIRDAWSHWLDVFSDLLKHSRNIGLFCTTLSSPLDPKSKKLFEDRLAVASSSVLDLSVEEQKAFSRSMLLDKDLSRQKDASDISEMLRDFQTSGITFRDPKYEDLWTKMETDNASLRSSFIKRLQVELDELESALTDLFLE